MYRNFTPFWSSPESVKSDYRKILALLFVATLVAVPACTQQQGYPLEGVVVEKRGGIASYWRVNKRISEGEKPLAGARVVVSFDQAGTDLVFGVATTDENGNYSIMIDSLPPSKTKSATYFITVEKAGYKKLVSEISLGRFAHALVNTIVLKPADDP